MEPEILAIIPAHCTSSEDQDFLVRVLGAHPLIAYSLAAGRKSAHISRTIVVTNSQSIAKLASDYGAESPFLLDTDSIPGLPDDRAVLLHTLDRLAEKEAYRPDIVVWLHPFTPIRPPECVDQAIEQMLSNRLVTVVHGVVPIGSAVLATWKMDLNGNLVPFPNHDPGVTAVRSLVQDTPLFQTRHISAFRTSRYTADRQLDGSVIYPLLLEWRYNVDVSVPFGWEMADAIIRYGQLEIIRPGRAPRPLPEHVELLVLDFDGVLTDNRVWVDADGREQVAASRGDSLGLSRLRKSGMEVLVLSTETNPVVTQRCRKLDLPVIQGVPDKAQALRLLLEERKLDPSHVVYLGNDVNDLPCFPLVGCAVVVADAQPEVLPQADMILTHCGGKGAVRELCDRLLNTHI